MALRVILVALCVVVVVSRASVRHHDAEWCRQEIPQINPFEEVKSYMNISEETLSRDDLDLMIDEIFYRVKCDVHEPAMNATCEDCLNAEHIYKVLGLEADAGLDNVQLEKAAAIITVFIMQLPVKCSAPPNWDTVTFEDFVEELMDFHDHRASKQTTEDEPRYFIMHQMEEVNTAINITYRPGPNWVEDPDIYAVCSDAHQPSFRSRDIFNNTDPLEITVGLLEEEVPTMTSHVIARVLQGYCIFPDRAASSGFPDEVDFISAMFRSYGSNTTCELNEKGYEEIVSLLAIGDAGPNVHRGHLYTTSGHRSLSDRIRHKRAPPRDDHDHDHGTGFTPDVTKECTPTTDLLRTFGINYLDVHISEDVFRNLCPALVQQSIQGCQYIATEPQRTGPTNAEKYGYSTISAVIISAAAAFGLLLGKARGTPSYYYAMSVMLGLALGSLAGDALLHLIPHSLGLHAHEDDGHDHGGEGGIVIEPFVWKMLASCGSLWLFFIIQMLLSSASKGGHGHSHGTEMMAAPKYKKSSDYAYDNGIVIDSITQKGKNQDPPEVVSTSSSDNAAIIDNTEALAPSSVAWMVSIGDGIHNFADGLAIGASFAADWRTGVSTSIAIICHELPHEFGDVSVLLAAGWSIKKTAVFQLASAFTCVIGVFVGVPISNDDIVREWIFIVTAGMFLYIALSDVAPELLEIYKNNSSKVKVFFAANGGILLGFGLMLIIAIFEEKIQI